jgi:exosome complex component RRP43
LIKIGSTTIVCGVRTEILPVSEIPSFRVNKTSQSYTPAPPVRRDDRYQEEVGNEGENAAIPLYHLLVPNIELATGCSPKHPANTAPSDEAQSLSQRLLSLLHTSQTVRTRDLEIIYTPPSESQDPDLGIDTDPQLKAYWVLYIDMVCISHGGSIFDAAWLAMYAALRNTMIPKAWWDADLEHIVCSPEIADARKLNLKGMPVPSSFGVFVPEKRTLVNQGESETSHWILIDTDSFEEESSAEYGTITVDVSGGKDLATVLRIEKNGGSIIGVDDIENITTYAEKRWHQWKDALNNAL